MRALLTLALLCLMGVSAIAQDGGAGPTPVPLGSCHADGDLWTCETPGPHITFAPASDPEAELIAALVTDLHDEQIARQALEARVTKLEQARQPKHRKRVRGHRP